MKVLCGTPAAEVFIRTGAMLFGKMLRAADRRRAEKLSIRPC
jgi:hypothetical protein